MKFAAGRKISHLTSIHTYAVECIVESVGPMRQVPIAVSTMIARRVAEMDGCGHVNNTTLPVWYEAGRRVVPGDIAELALHRLNIAVVSQVRF